MKRSTPYQPVMVGLLAALALTALPASAREDAAPAERAAANSEEAARYEALRRRWAQMSDEDRARFLERRRAQAADQGSSVRERLQHLSPRQKAQLRKRLANMSQPPHRPHHPQARRRAQAAGR